MKSIQEKRMMSQLRAPWAAFAMVLVFSLGASGVALAENTIQSINSTQQAGVEVVRIELSEPLTAIPAGFTIQAPARIAIDLPGVGNALGKTSVEINQGNLRSVSVAQAGERTRLVLNLKQATTYRAQLQGKALLLILEAGGAPTATASAAEPVRFAPSINTSQLPLKEVDFRKGNDGAGRVIVNLANNQVCSPDYQNGIGKRLRGQHGRTVHGDD